MTFAPPPPPPPLPRTLSKEQIRDLRNQIPLDRYLALNHVLVTTGIFPIMDLQGNFLDPHGMPSETPHPQHIQKTALDKSGIPHEYDEVQALPIQTRAKLVADSIKRILPDARPEDIQAPPSTIDIPALTELEDNLSKLSFEEVTQRAIEHESDAGQPNPNATTPASAEEEGSPGGEEGIDTPEPDPLCPSPEPEV